MQSPPRPRRRARAAAGVLAVAGAALLAFGWWGVETSAGRQRYDEMDGIIPFATGVLGAILLLVGTVTASIAMRKRRE